MKGASERAGQTFLGIKVSQALFDAVEAASGGDKSQFVREAIAEKLKAKGHVIRAELVKAPSRKGKGGPKRASKIKSQASIPKILKVHEVPSVRPPPDTEYIPSLSDKLAREREARERQER